MMSNVHSNDKTLPSIQLRSIEDYIKNSTGIGQENMKLYGLPLCHAIQAFHDENYKETFNTIYPIRQGIVNLGNSNAQRDVFKQLLITSAKRSSQNGKLTENQTIID